MASTSITLPVPIHVEHKKPGSRTTSTKKTYSEAEFSVPSFSIDQVGLVAQWCQPWSDSKHTTSSDLNLVGGDWQRKLSQAEHMVALVAVDGAFYTPVRGREHEGAVQYLITAKNALSAQTTGLLTVNPFGSRELYPPYMCSHLRNYDVVGGRPFAENDLPEGQVLLATDEADRIVRMTGYLEKNFIAIDGVLFSRNDEPMILVRTGAEKVSMSIVTKRNDDAIIPIFEHYFRLDEYDRALQMVEDRWPKEMITAQFSDLGVVDPEPLSDDFEVIEALRLTRRFFTKLAPSLNQLDWETAGPWYALKKKLVNPAPGGDDVDEMISLVANLADALERNEEIDEEWRQKTVLYGRLGVERWMYRPITFSGPHI
jgi:hypothetical protein